MKAITSNKALCVVIMIILIAAGLFLGGMWSLNAKHERISSHRALNPQVYNAEAAAYNEQLEKFPANIISKVMPVRGALEYDPNADMGTEIYGIISDLSLLGAAGILVLLTVIGGLIKLIY